MPWTVAFLLTIGALVLIAKAVADRKGGYDDPANTLDDRFDHMIDSSSQRDRELQDQRRGGIGG